MSQEFSTPYQPPSLDENQIVGGVEADAFRKVAFWQRFFSVLGYIGTVLMMGVFAVQLVLAGVNAQDGPGEAIGAVIGMGLGLVISALVYLIPSIRLGAASKATRDFGEGRINLAQYIHHQKMFWRYTGITISVVMIIYFGLLVVVIIGAGFAFAV
jgi:hypothetical protein